jgi:nitrite reductase/ring-hydroxylating ferredoxin subunit
MREGPIVPAYREGQVPCYQEVIADDVAPAPDPFREFTEADVPIAGAARFEYTSPEFARRELKAMWPRVWQFACREEQIPEPGDLVVYNSPGASFIVVRTESGDIRAYYNSCLHRGMRLCDHDTSVKKLACPFHGFTWTLDGKLEHVPARWDFPNLKEAEMRLPEARVDCWGGFVFINRDENAPPLETYLGRLARHIPESHFAERRLTTIIRQVVKGNWKGGVDAFAEVFHVAGLHPQVLAYSGDSSTQYDVWPDDPHVSRWLSPAGVPNEYYPYELSEQQKLDMMMRAAGATAVPTLAEGRKARTLLAEVTREFMSKRDGCDYSAVSDTEANDGMQYSLFPNMMLFPPLGQPWAYRFLPIRDDPNESTFELFILGEKAKEGEGDGDIQVIELGHGQSFHDAVGDFFSPMLAEVLDQDVWGIEGCQDGMRDGGGADLIFSRYQEKRLRHFHQTLHRYVDGELPNTAADGL